jgi:hypothetical protein
MRMTTAYRNRSSLIFSVIVFTAVLFLPWPDGRGWLLCRCVATTARNLNTTAVRVLRNFGAFQADLNTPRAGEYVLPPQVQQVLTMLGGRGRGVGRYQISDAIAANPWVLQQIVTSAWPRRLEKDAKARFVLNDEPVMPGCTLIDQQRDISLVYCP